MCVRVLQEAWATERQRLLHSICPVARETPHPLPEPWSETSQGTEQCGSERRLAGKRPPALHRRRDTGARCQILSSRETRPQRFSRDILAEEDRQQRHMFSSVSLSTYDCVVTSGVCVVVFSFASVIAPISIYSRRVWICVWKRRAPFVPIKLLWFCGFNRTGVKTKRQIKSRSCFYGDAVFWFFKATS